MNKEMSISTNDSLKKKLGDVYVASCILPYVAEKYDALIIHAFSTGDWQGENTVVLARVSNRTDCEFEFGLATMSYGSCSYCDLEYSLMDEYSGDELTEKFREEADRVHVTWYSADEMVKFLDKDADTQAWFYVYDNNAANKNVKDSISAIRRFLSAVKEL